MPRVGSQTQSLLLYKFNLYKDSQERKSLYFITTCLEMFNVEKFLQKEYTELEKEDKITYDYNEIKVVAYTITYNQTKKINCENQEVIIEEIKKNIGEMLFE